MHVQRTDCSMCQINKNKSKYNHYQYARQIKQACSLSGYSVLDCSAVFYHTLIEVKTIANRNSIILHSLQQELTFFSFICIHRDPITTAITATFSSSEFLGKGLTSFASFVLCQAQYGLSPSWGLQALSQHSHQTSHLMCSMQNSSHLTGSLKDARIKHCNSGKHDVNVLFK